MKKIVLTMMALFALATIFSACEKTDYKHPLHRANGK
jgi:hypothetical protein